MGKFSLRKAALEEMHAVFAGLVSSGEIPGVVALLSQGDDVHVDAVGSLKFGGPRVQRDSLFRVASMSKPVSAVAAMTLVEEGKLQLDEPVDVLLPELANRRVLKRLDGPLEETVPAERPITARDLLTMCMGLGHLMWECEEYPIKQELARLKLLQGPPHPREEPGPDEWIARVGSLPLMHQPGERFMYDLSLEVLGVLISRAAGQPLDRVLQERVFEPLGMDDSGFYVPPEKMARFATSYEIEEQSGGLAVYDEAEGGEWSEAPKSPMAASGLVSTVDDFWRFGKMMLGGGQYNGARILTAETVSEMTADQLAPSQKEGAELFLGEGGGWGFGMSVRPPGAVPSGFGWDGGLGTSWYSDPNLDLTGVLLTQVSWTSPVPPKVREEFWRLAYEAAQ